LGEKSRFIGNKKLLVHLDVSLVKREARKQGRSFVGRARSTAPSTQRRVSNGGTEAEGSAALAREINMPIPEAFYSNTVFISVYVEFFFSQRRFGTTF